MKYQDQWAVRERRKLIERLGGKCVACGGRERLELHHIYGARWTLRDVSSSGRVSIYRREARNGELEVRCKACNKAAEPLPRPVTELGKSPC